jgi:glycosyltransferase involved in cell wall biosynthesis
MRVLMLTDLYPPFIGGIEEHVRNLSRGLAARGYEVAVATMGSDDLPARTEDDGVRVHRLRSTAQRAPGAATPSGRPYSAPFPDPEVVLGLRRVLREERPDVVHGHNWLARSFMPLKGASDAALALSLHDYGVVCAKRSLVYRGEKCSGPGFEKCLRCAGRNYGAARGMAVTLSNWAMQPIERDTVDVFLPVSNAVARDSRLAEAGAPFEVLPNFVPHDIAHRASADHAALARLPKEAYWLFVGALGRHKGIHVLLEAYARLREAPPLVLIGPRWHDTPESLPRNVVALGGLPHDAVMAAWRGAALGLVPSVFPDPCPTVALEAMACGVPLVASRIGGLPDIVAHEESGILIEPGNADALEAALRRLMADPAAGDRMGECGRQRLAAFTDTAVLDRLEAIYAGLVG